MDMDSEVTSYIERADHTCPLLTMYGILVQSLTEGLHGESIQKQLMSKPSEH